ncbi:transporter substrate-binding domain-containing protein [Alteromonas ponticola]|uniref:Transporter substrate-binding domain-containing protein n=1 Tax=Alteromonas aquimaris TaxID=2998417 RepID=A0ABT3P4R9_9ALTE|nr:transporter substrate-binding domain-containing protein [Alteromonas aquimaris]MCW8107749.1 transporter substrate-binding domain-containing protein [Alteromonas aquimaris]
MQPLFFRLLLLECAAIVVTSSMNVAAFSLELNELTYITENNASFNYVRNGQLEGFAVEVLLSASADLGSPVQRDEILVQPWARAFKNALRGPNTVLFSTIRTPEREDKFQWVGPFASESDVVIALKARQIKITDSAKLKSYITGAVRGDVGEEILHEIKVPSDNIVLLPDSTSMGAMLTAGRIDVWVFGEVAWSETLKSAGLNPSLFEVVFRFPPKHYYFALSRDINPMLVQSFQLAIDQTLEKYQDGSKFSLPSNTGLQ